MVILRAATLRHSQKVLCRRTGQTGFDCSRRARKSPFPDCLSRLKDIRRVTVVPGRFFAGVDAKRWPGLECRRVRNRSATETRPLLAEAIFRCELAPILTRFSSSPSQIADRTSRVQPSVNRTTTKTAARRWGSLPPRMRVLYVTTHQRTGGWLAEALAADSASTVILEEAQGFGAGASRLRDEVFDAVLVSHDPGELDALALADALRAGGSDEPLVILGEEPQADMMALCLEAKADAYLCVHDTTTRTLIWVVSRAIEHQRLQRDHRKLAQAEERRIDHERTEIDQQVAEQRGLILALEANANATEQANALSTCGAQPNAPTVYPTELEAHYRELLRAYVVMGTGNLASEMRALAQLLAGAQVTAAQTLELHVRALENLLAGLGARSARHVMNRADLLALEVCMHLCEAYRSPP